MRVRMSETEKEIEYFFYNKIDLSLANIATTSINNGQVRLQILEKESNRKKKR